MVGIIMSAIPSNHQRCRSTVGVLDEASVKLVESGPFKYAGIFDFKTRNQDLTEIKLK